MILVQRFQGLGAAPTNTLRAWPATLTNALAILKPFARIAAPSRPMGLDATPGYQFCEAIAHLAHMPAGVRTALALDPHVRTFRTTWNAFRDAACGRGGDAATIVTILETLVDVFQAVGVVAHFGTNLSTAINDVKSRIGQLNDEVRFNECASPAGWTLMTPVRIPGQYYQGGAPPADESKMSTGAKVAIGLGIFAVLGAGLYVAMR